MDIIWHGNSCFTCKGKNATVVVNPDKSIKASLKGDLVLSSIGEEDLAEVEGSKRTFSWPGEYEVSEIPITALNAWTRSRGKEEEEGETTATDTDRTIIFCFEIDKVKICHLGNLGHKLTSEITDEIGDVDILLMPLGEDNPLKEKTEIVFDQIEPRSVIPYGTFTEESAKKALGSPFDPVEPKFTATNSSLPDDKTQYVLLNKA